MSTTTRLELKLRALRQWLKPDARVRDVLHGETWEVISYPWIEGKRILVNVQMTPHAPMTIVTVNALALEPAPPPDEMAVLRPDQREGSLLARQQKKGKQE